jgi:hypothetical protein
MAIDLNSGSGPLVGPSFTAGGATDISGEINALIDEGLAAEEAGRPARTYLGASMLGEPCLRRIVYQYRGAAAKPPEGRMRRIWARGHAAEERLVRWLRRAGFTVVDRGKDGGQIGFSQAGGRIAGHIDGAVTAGPRPLPYPLLLELKCLNNKSWNDLRKKGLKESKPTYYSQINLYMGYLDFAHCLFGAENADTEELWWNVVPFDLAEAQRVSDRAVAVLSSDNGPLPPRISETPDFWRCRFCDYAETCHAGGADD